MSAQGKEAAHQMQVHVAAETSKPQSKIIKTDISSYLSGGFDVSALDGLRAIASFTVIAFHALLYWGTLLPLNMGYKVSILQIILERIYNRVPSLLHRLCSLCPNRLLAIPNTTLTAFLNRFLINRCRCALQCKVPLGSTFSSFSLACGLLRILSLPSSWLLCSTMSEVLSGELSDATTTNVLGASCLDM